MKKRMKKKNKGITLVALIITIIILLILAGISISALTETGLFEKTKEAKEKYQNAQESENNYLEKYSEEISKYTSIDNKEKIIKGRYILFDIYDHIGGDFTSISEITLYDADRKKIVYNVIKNEAFDSVYQDAIETKIWEDHWGYENLYDSNISYLNNTEGKYNCMGLMGPSDANSNNYSRFIIDLGEQKDISNINICLGDVEDRTPKSVSAYLIDNYSNETYLNNVKQRNNEGLTLIKTIEFSEVITTPTWYSFIGEKKSKKILIEVNDHIGGNCASIAEIKLLNKNGENIIYNILKEDVFDSPSNGKSVYWENSRNIWDYTKLYDNKISYTSNEDGRNNCALFLAESNPNTDHYARFVLNSENVDIDDIKVCVGDVENRTPKKVSAYIVDNYSDETYLKNVKGRSDEGLTLLKRIEFSEVITTPTWYSLKK